MWIMFVNEMLYGKNHVRAKETLDSFNWFSQADMVKINLSPLTAHSLYK